MVASTATLSRQVALLQQQVRAIRQTREAEHRPPRSATDLGGDLGIALDDWQARALSTDARDVLLLASRQAGKSTVAAIMALHQAAYAPSSLMLIVSPTERQSNLLLRTVRKQVARLRALPAPIADGALSLELHNCSAIHALPGSEATVRGFSAVDLLILDEGARIPDELY